MAGDHTSEAAATAEDSLDALRRQIEVLSAEVRKLAKAPRSKPDNAKGAQDYAVSGQKAKP